MIRGLCELQKGLQADPGPLCGIPLVINLFGFGMVLCIRMKSQRGLNAVME